MKYRYTIIFCILISIISINTKAQVSGSWIVSSSYGNAASDNSENGYMNYRMQFPIDGTPTLELLSSEETMTTHFDYAFSIGDFSECSGALNLYLTDNYYYNTDQQELDIRDVKISPEARLIKKDGDVDYQLLYSAEYNTTGNFWFYYVNIKKNGNGYESNWYCFPFETVEGHSKIAFSLSNEVDDEQYIFTVCAANNWNYTDDFGLLKYKITEEGFELADELISDSQSSNNHFVLNDYMGYNLEIQDKNETEDPTIAWINSPLSSTANQKIFVYDPSLNDDHYALDLSIIGSNGVGRIGGIEFSPFPNEEDYMFVSTEVFGLIKINWHTGALVHQFTPTNIDFSHTSVQKAPNGKIYAVSDDGQRFGEIGPNNSFNPLAFDYPESISTAPSSHINYKTVDINNQIVKYFSLPDNDKPMVPTFQDMLVIDSQSSQNVSSLSDMTWDMNDGFPDNKIMFEHGFRLTDGVTLNIDGMYLEFNQKNFAKVIIEPGCKLIIDNESVLTSHHCYTDAKWAGIEVWGNPSKNQDPISSGVYHQGYLEITDSKIENAETAIAIRKEGTWGEYGGGIVKATNTEFLNNAKSIHFAPYKNMFKRTVNNQTLEFEMQNECSFELCDFEINNNYFDDSKFSKHADIVQVHRIPFKGCDFILNNNSEDVSPYNCGIAAYSAGVHVDKAFNGHHSSFTGFYIGISSNHSTDNTYYHVIKETQFINNSVGIRNTNTDNVVIINNIFKIGENNCGKGLCGWAPGYGIDLRTATGFVIENNKFLPFPGITGDTYGIRLYETATLYDEVYNNEFDDLSIGNLSDGLNTFNGDDNEGVAYLCNDNDGNNIDFLLDGDINIEIEIHHHNGSEIYASGNTFSPNASMHIQNNGQEIITFYNNGIQSPDPTKCTPNYIDLDPALNLHSCPDHYGGIGGRELALDATSRQSKEDEYEAAKTNLDAVESLYESLTDGGNTEGTELTIATAQPGDTWELRANLLGLSPYLSKEVLIQAADKTEVLPESVLFEILSANPDELRKTDLLVHLENKENPLPEYMVNILRQMAAGSSAKTVLLLEKDGYKKGKIEAVKEIIHSILINEELDHDDLRTWLAKLESYNGDKQIVASYMNQQDYSNAQALIELLPELYDLEGDALVEHNEWADLMNMQLSWQSEGRNPMSLTENELAILNDLADNGNKKAKYQAQGILEQFYGNNYIDCIMPPEGNKSTTAYTKNDLAQAMGLSLVANPNPAKEYTEFTYSLPFDNENATISIFDITGRLLEQKQLNSPINKVAYNTSKLVAGSYTIEIRTYEYSYSTKLIVQ